MGANGEGPRARACRRRQRRCGRSGRGFRSSCASGRTPPALRRWGGIGTLGPSVPSIRFKRDESLKENMGVRVLSIGVEKEERIGNLGL